MRPNPSNAFSALGSPMTMGKASLFLSSPDVMSPHMPLPTSWPPRDNQEENPKDLKTQLSIVQNQCSPSITSNNVLKHMSVFTRRTKHQRPLVSADQGQSLVQHRTSRARRAIRHHLHETLRYAMHKFHKCVFVFTKPCCLLHKFHYSPCIFLVLLPVT